MKLYKTIKEIPVTVLLRQGTEMVLIPPSTLIRVEGKTAWIRGKDGKLHELADHVHLVIEDCELLENPRHA